MSTALKSHTRDGVAAGWLRRSAALVLCGLYLTLLITGFFSAPRGWGQLIALALLLAGSGGLVAERLLRRGDAPETEDRLGAAWDRLSGEGELGVALGVSAYAAIQVTGALGAELHAIIYLLVAAVATVQPRRAAWGVVGLSVGIEAAAWLSGAALGGEPASGGTLLLRVVFLIGFAGLSDLFLRADLSRARQRLQAEAAAKAAKTRDAARALRFDAQGAQEATAGSEERAEAEQRLVQDALESVDGGMGATLRLLKEALGCHTAAVLWFDATGRRLRIRQAVSSGALAETLQPGEGALAGVLRRREPVVLPELRPGYRGLSYYRRPEDEPVRSFCGVPLLEGDEVVGALCLDRTSALPFGETEVAAAAAAAAGIVRAVQTERFFLVMDRARHELSRFYAASRQLNHALTPEQVYTVALRCVRELAPVDLAALVRCEEVEGRLRFQVTQSDAAEGDDRASALLQSFAAQLQGLEFAENNGLVAMAVRTGHYLPYNGEYNEGRSVVFTPQTPLRGVESLLILPLVVQEHPIGAFVLACREAGAFPRTRREILEVIANQAAISLENAHMFARMELMATTDGLTGLNNHRTFQNKLAEALARAERHSAPCSIILTDIDHFKSINDTHGHPVGDEVLRQVAAAFKRTLRQTDVPARYGGEEFAVVLENTPRAEAVRIAERLRQEVKRMKFRSAKAEFSISMSFGVGLFGEDAADKPELIDRTDQALYYAKSHGRDQVRAWHDVQHAPDLGAPKKK